jgi:Zn-dependent M28 family amino/carboxypeptidase
VRKKFKFVLISVLLSIVGVALAGVVAVKQPFDWSGQSVIQGASDAEMLGMPVRLKTHVEKLAITFHPRDYTHLDNLNRTADYIAAEFKALGLEVIEQPYTVDGVSYRNIIARLGPNSKSLMVIGAHYDSAGDHNPGADDNASGVAGLIELAKLLSKKNLKHRVELVAWTLEEPPFFRTQHMGSFIHARSMKAVDANIMLMMSLECIGYFSDEPNSQDYPVPGMSALYPNTGNFIAVVGRMEDGDRVRRVKFAMRNATPLAVESINAPSAIQGIDFSDQLNYWNEGYTGLLISDSAFYRNKAYHTAADTVDRLDYMRMSQVVQGVHAAVLSIDAKP